MCVVLLAVKIITGSLQGVIRVHQPHQQGYHIEDILLEAQLDSSILQLAAGNFLGYGRVLLDLCSLSVACLHNNTCAVAPMLHVLRLNPDHQDPQVIHTQCTCHLQRDQLVPGHPASTQAVSVHPPSNGQQLPAAQQAV